MTGQDLLHSLSFVDERYIAEAETAVFYRKIPWAKVLSAAACLCILIVGALTLENMGAKEEAAAPAAAAPESVTESFAEEAAPKEEVSEEEAVAETGTVPSGELQHIPYAVVRIVRITEDSSFAVVVEEITQDPTPLAIGMELTLVIDPDMVPGEAYTDTEYTQTVTENMVVEIRDGAYDAGIHTLYAEGVFAFEE